jgi:hypothetical protein
MVATAGKIKSISEDLGLSETQVALVIYDYMCYCLQEALIDGETKTVFGILKINENNRLDLQTDKRGLIDLIDKRDLKIIRKIAENGPNTSIFGNL